MPAVMSKNSHVNIIIIIFLTVFIYFLYYYYLLLLCLRRSSTVGHLIKLYLNQKIVKGGITVSTFLRELLK